MYCTNSVCNPGIPLLGACKESIVLINDSVSDVVERSAEDHVVHAQSAGIDKPARTSHSALDVEPAEVTTEQSAMENNNAAPQNCISSEGDNAGQESMTTDPEVCVNQELHIVEHKCAEHVAEKRVHDAAVTRGDDNFSSSYAACDPGLADVVQVLCQLMERFFD